MVSIKNILFSTFLLFPFATNVYAAYDESLSGDLSGSFSSPTLISLASTGGIITGTVGNNGNTGATNGSDADYFTFSLASNQTLSAINILSSSGDNASFFGYTASPSFGGQSAGDLDGFVLFGNTSGDVLPGLAGGPVTGGTHSFWLQETAGVIQSYAIEFQVSQVPLPGALVFMLSSLGSLLIAKHRAVLHKNKNTNT